MVAAMYMSKSVCEVISLHVHTIFFVLLVASHGPLHVIIRTRHFWTSKRYVASAAHTHTLSYSQS
jgi:hypothetical protein